MTSTYSSTNFQPPILSGKEALCEPSITHIDVFPYSSNIRLRSANTIETFPHSSDNKLEAANTLETYLSNISAMAIDSAIQVQLQNPYAKLVIPGETPFEDLPNTTDLMAQRAIDAGVDKDNIVRLYTLSDGRYLNNTFLQAQGLREYHQGNTEVVLVISIDNHGRRVLSAMKAFNTTPRYFTTVESILEAQGIHDYDRYLPVINWLRRTELLTRLVSDRVGLPKGQIPNYVTGRKGPRVVDVIEVQGHLVKEDRFAWKKRAQLLAEAAATHVKAA